MQNWLRFIKSKILVIGLSVSLVALLAGQTLWAVSQAKQPRFSADLPEQRIAYLQSLGWQVGECAEEKRVVLPQTFSDVYQNYNQLQKQQGFDLSPYKGKSCLQYTYPLLNFPLQSQEVYLHLLVCEGVVIGGDIASVGLQGFMTTFK